MNRHLSPFHLLIVALLLSLTACGSQIGIIGGADGPTSIFVTNGKESDTIVIGPNGEISAPNPDAESVTEDVSTDGGAATDSVSTDSGAATDSVSTDSGAAMDSVSTDSGAATDSVSPDTDSVTDAVSPDGAAPDATETIGAAEIPANPDSASANADNASSGPDGIRPAPDEPPTPLTLAALSGPWTDAVKAELSAFEQGNHVICNVLELSRDELAQAPAGCDLVMVHSSSVAAFRKSGYLANLSALGYKPDSDFIPNVTEICTDGHTYSLAPWFGNASVLLCNKNSLIASNSSTDRIQSLENMLAVCKAAKQRGEIGFAYHEDFRERVTLDFLPVLRSFDGWFIDRDGKPSIYTKKFQDAVNFFLELTATGKSLPHSEFVSAIDSGKAAMGFIYSDAYAPSAKSAATYLVFPGAASRGGETHSAGTCAIWGLGIPSGSQHPELAERLLEYLINPNIQKSILPSGVTPCRYSILQDPELQKDYPCYSKVLAALENSQYVPALTEWPQMCDILGEELWKVMAGRKLVTECLADAQSRMESLLSA